MKTLFKQQLKSLSKNKVFAVALVLFIFISSAVFATFNNTLINFRTSYNSVVEDGNLHQFTLKENFQATGSFKLFYEVKEGTNCADQATDCQIEVTIGNATGSYQEYLGAGEPVLQTSLLNQKHDDYLWNGDQINNDGSSPFNENSQDYQNNLTSKNQLMTGVTEKVNSWIKTAFYQYLETEFKDNPIIWNERHAVNVPASQDGNLYKVISTSPDDKVDKLISEQYPIGNFNNYYQVESFQDYVIAKEGIQDNPIKKLFAKIIEEGTSLGYSFDSPNCSKGYSCVLIAKVFGNDTGSATVSDPTAFFANADSKFAEENGLVAVDPNVLIKNYNVYLANLASELEAKLNANNITEVMGEITEKSTMEYFFSANEGAKLKPENIIKVDQSAFAFTGGGITPDYMYPIFDSSHIIPNYDNEAILFANQAGYERISDAFRGSPREDYRVGVFQNFNLDQESDIQNNLDIINQEAANYMAWPGGVKAAYLYNDKDEKILLAPQRVTFVIELMKSIGVVTYGSLVILVLLTAFAVLVLFSRDIREKSSVFGIMKANGYKTLEIASSYQINTVLFGVVGAASGFLLGLVLQKWTVALFANFWNLPLDFIGFSWVSFGISLLLPVIGLMCLVYLICWSHLRVNSIKLISDAEKHKTGFLTKALKPIINKRKITTKFSFSFVTQSKLKFLMLLTCSAAALSIGTLGVASLNTFADAKNNTFAVKDYKYRVNLYSPTFEGGPYNGIANDQVGQNVIYPDGQSPTTITAEDYQDLNNSALPKKGIDSYLATPSFADISWQSLIEYLHYQVQVKSVLDMEFLGQNPWALASGLIPSNQLNSVEETSDTFINFLHSIYENANPDGKYGVIAWEGGPTSENPEAKWTVPPASRTTGLEISDDWRMLVQDGLAASANSVDNSAYRIVYNTVPLLKTSDPDNTKGNDITYTMVDGELTNGTVNKNYDLKKPEIEIYGIGEDGLDYINLGNAQYENLVEYSQNHPLEHPIIVSKYALERMGLSVGDALEVNQKNWIYRYLTDVAINDEEIGKEVANSPQVTQFKIIGSFDSYFGSEAYTTQEITNQTLGMNNDIWKNNYGSNIAYFNGYYTNDEELTTIKNNLALYGYTGLNPGGDKITLDFLQTKIFSDLNEGVKTSNKNVLKYYRDNYTKLTYWNLEDTPDNEAQNEEAFLQFANTYSDQNFQSASEAFVSPYVAITSEIDARDVESTIFDNLVNTANQIQIALIVLIMAIALILVILISHLIVRENNRSIGLFRALGYSNDEVLRMFVGMYFPILILGIGISIPVSYGLITLFQSVVMNVSQILLPISLSWWAILLGIIPLLAIFVITYFISWYDLHKQRILTVIKDK